MFLSKLNLPIFQTEQTQPRLSPSVQNWEGICPTSYFIAKTSHHWNRGKFNGNHWELYAYGKPVGKGRLADLNRAKNPTLYSIARWVDSELVRRPRMEVFPRTMSPKHFVNDDWNTGGSCGNTIPLSNGSEALQDHSSDLPAERAVNGTQVKLLDITAISQVTTTRRGAYLKL